MNAALRLFIALELPPSLLEALADLQDDLRAQFPGRAARWVPPSGIHLTLKFLGDVPPAQVDEVASELRAAAAGHTPFELWAEGLGVFPNSKQARVLWVGVKGDLEALARLQASVERHIAPLGYPTESRPFSAHLTLARASRNATRAEREALGALAAGAGGGRRAGSAWQVRGVSLIRSQLKPGGAFYTQLAEAPLPAD